MEKQKQEGGQQELHRTKKTPFEMVWGECVGSLLLGNECAAVEVSVYFCRLSFQGPDWQLFLELELHSLLNRLSRVKEEGGHGHTRTTAHAHKRTTLVNTHADVRTMWRHAHTPIC